MTDVWDKRLLDTYTKQFFNEDAIVTPAVFHEYLYIYTHTIIVLSSFDLFAFLRVKHIFSTISSGVSMYLKAEVQLIL